MLLNLIIGDTFMLESHISIELIKYLVLPNRVKT